MIKIYRKKDIILTGFALFAMLFGAGYLIFPPKVGFDVGEMWKAATLGFFITGIGIPLLAIISAAYAGKDLDDFANRVSPKFSKVFNVVLILAIGPFLALPRTGATAYEMAIIPHTNGADVDMNRANEARDMTKRLSLLAEKYKCAILLIGHMNKAGGNKAAYRGMGSIDFFAVARSVLLVGRIEGEPDLRAVVQIKNNLAAFGHSKAVRLTETGFEWIGDYEITADEVLGGIAPKVNKLEQAKKMLRELAETSTSVQSSEIFDMAEDLNISKRTLDNAKKELEIKARRIVKPE